MFICQGVYANTHQCNRLVMFLVYSLCVFVLYDVKTATYTAYSHSFACNYSPHFVERVSLWIYFYMNVIKNYIN